MLSEKSQPTDFDQTRPVKISLANYLIEFFGVFLYVFCAEVLNLAQLFSGHKSWDRELSVMHLVPVTLLFICARYHPCPRLLAAHQNPGITLALTIFGQFPLNSVAPYICSQLLGAVSASLFVHGIFKAIPFKAFLDPAVTLWGPIVSIISINNLTPDEIGALMLSGPRFNGVIAILQVGFGMSLGIYLLSLTRQTAKTNTWFVDAPGYLYVSGVLYFMSAAAYNGYLELNTAHALSSQITSLILYGKVVTLFRWSYLVFAFINIPAIIAGVAFKLTNPMDQPDPQLTDESGELC